MITPKREKVILHEVTAQKILLLIKEQKLRQGDKLPTERALAAQLGVSRTSLRETLQTLEANGIVRIRHGSGIYVDTFDDSMMNPYEELDQNNYQDVLTVIHQMMEARMMTEVYCTGQVARIITPSQMAQLRRHEEEEYCRLYAGGGRTPAPGLDFEQIIVDFLQNPIISNMHRRLNSSWKSYLAVLNAVVLSPDRRHRDHLAVILALEDHNVQKAEKAMQHHLLGSLKSIDSLLARYRTLGPKPDAASQDPH